MEYYEDKVLFPRSADLGLIEAKKTGVAVVRVEPFPRSADLGLIEAQKHYAQLLRP